MKRLAAVALGAALFAGVAVAGLGQRATLGRPLVLRGAVAGSPLLGLDYRRHQVWLVRLDPKTLRTRPGRRLALWEFSRGWSYSPDLRLLVFGNQSSTGFSYSPARVRVVDVHTLRKVRDVRLGMDGEVIYTHWVAPDRLLAVVQSREDSGNEGDPPIVTDRVVVVDPATGAVRSSKALEGTVIALEKVSDALVLVLEGSSDGPVRLVVADRDGRVASVTLERVRAGRHETPTEVPRLDTAAVAVDRDGGHAYVLAAGDPVADVSLATLAVEYHTPAQPVSVLGRLHNWLEPRAQAKGPLEGSWRHAAWLGEGQLAVFGYDYSTYQTDEGLAVRERPSGLLVIDTRSWAAHMVDPRSSAIAVATNALLSWGSSWDGGTQRQSGSGLSAYDPTGSQRYHLFGRQVVYDVQLIGSRAFVGKSAPDPGYSIVSISHGRQLRIIRGHEMPLVLSSAGPPFYG
jgi:hypothetical protein